MTPDLCWIDYHVQQALNVTKGYRCTLRFKLMGTENKTEISHS